MKSTLSDYPIEVYTCLQDLCEGATYYADLIHKKLKAAGYYDEVGQFDVTEQLCVTINDIEQVSRTLQTGDGFTKLTREYSSAWLVHLAHWNSFLSGNIQYMCW